MPVRMAKESDLAFLPEIELSGDAMFAAYGVVFPPAPATIEAVIDSGSEIMVIGDPVIGFAALVDLDGHPHLEQISIHAAHGHRGHGTTLLTEVIKRHGPGLTLLTFRDLPWNAPWYARHGFQVLPPASFGPELKAHWDAEIEAGLHLLSPRVAMHLPR